jgi:hypothetical protein
MQPTKVDGKVGKLEDMEEKSGITSWLHTFQHLFLVSVSKTIGDYVEIGLDVQESIFFLRKWWSLYIIIV